jgi:hypothetical protein
MRVIIPLMILVSVAFAASLDGAKSIAEPNQSLRLLRIEATIPGAWDQGEWFQDDLEASLNGFQNFEVIPRARVNAFLAKTQIDPVRRDSVVLDLIDAHFPVAYLLKLQVQAPISETHRRPVLFFMGQRVIKMEVMAQWIAYDAKHPKLRGEFVVDTTIQMGFCGIIDCVVPPFDVQSRLQVERDLFHRLELKLKARMEEMMVIPVEYKAYQDTMILRRTRDSIGILDSLRVFDSLQSKKKVDSTATMVPVVKN